MNNTVIPLFPLALVVYPGQVVPLHIFEERYKAMIAACRGGEGGAGNAPFGISFQGATLYRVGCSLKIEKILREYEDGRLDLVAVGKQRYRMLKLYNDQPYFTAAVEVLEDGEETMDKSLAEQVGERYRQWCKLARESAQPSPAAVAPSRPSFHIAQAVGLELEQRQLLLEMTSENQRLRALGEHLERRLAVLQEHLEAKRRMQVNGHPDP